MADPEEKGYGTHFGGETLADFVKNHDVISLTDGGMARTPQDTGNGVDLGGGGSYVLPAAKPNALGGVKQGGAVADVADAPTAEQFNALLAQLRASGVIA